MKVVLTKARSVDSSAKGLKASVAVLLGVVVLSVSGVAGALVHSHFLEPTRIGPAAFSMPVISDPTKDNAERKQVEALAAKVGELQAKIIELDGLSRRVAEVAGIPFTDPEIQAGLDQAAPPIMDYIGDAQLPSLKRKMSFLGEPGLDIKVENLHSAVNRQKDWFRMMDLALTQRVGAEAGLPSLRPVDYPYLSSSFGWRRHPITGRHVMHEGLDFAAPRGTPIQAASGGVVTEAGYRSGYGKTVEIHHGSDIVTRYAHASDIKVKVGDIVERGQEIATVGSTGLSTGPHLHFEVRVAGHPLDPVLFLEKIEPDATLVTHAGEQLDAAGTKVR